MKGQTYKRCKCPAEDLPRRADGTLGNCRRDHGSWYYRHDLPTSANGRRRQVKQGGYSTEKEARAALTDALARLDRGTYVDRSKLTVGDYLDQWLEGRVNLRPASVVFYRVAVERYLRPGLGQLRLDQLRVDDVERAFARIRRGLDGHGHPVSPALIGRLKTTLRAALNVAVKRQLIHVNPAALVEVEAHTRPTVHVWDATTTGRFLDSAAEDWHGPLWHLIASFGLRRGEAAGLRWHDVDLEHGVLAIVVQRTQVGRQIIEATPKTKAGVRVLTLDQGTVRVLRSHRTRQDTAARPRRRLGPQRSRLHHGGRPRVATAVHLPAVREGMRSRGLPTHTTPRPAPHKRRSRPGCGRIARGGQQATRALATRHYRRHLQSRASRTREGLKRGKVRRNSSSASCPAGAHRSGPFG